MFMLESERVCEGSVGGWDDCFHSSGEEATCESVCAGFNENMELTITWVLKVRDQSSLPLKMSFCEADGTPVACMRASDRSLTVSPLPLSS